MGHVAGQLIFVLAALISAAGLAGAVLWFGRSRGREPRVLVALVVGVFAFIVAAVLASWPTD
ncbi:hypothetical protein [Nonomuraea wenchangensis]|uniref:hypothetical protein n=1 Tax=Nonomuraea wenchangensis TaxID=568860 RepID=UPI003332C1D7